MRMAHLVLVSFILLAFSVSRIQANFLIILLQRSQIFTSLRELSFLHSLTHVPVDKRTLGIHQIKLVIQTGPGLRNSCGVTQHTHSTLNLGQVTTRNSCGGLVVDANLQNEISRDLVSIFVLRSQELLVRTVLLTAKVNSTDDNHNHLTSQTNLEASWTPIHKLNGSFRLDCRNSCIHILWYHITTEQQTASHIFAMTWIAFHHLIGWLKAGVGDFSNSQLLMIGFLSRDDRSISGQWEVNTWVRHQVGLQ